MWAVQLQINAEYDLCQDGIGLKHECYGRSERERTTGL